MRARSVLMQYAAERRVCCACNCFSRPLLQIFPLAHCAQRCNVLCEMRKLRSLGRAGRHLYAHKADYKSRRSPNMLRLVLPQSLRGCSKRIYTPGTFPSARLVFPAIAVYVLTCVIHRANINCAKEREIKRATYRRRRSAISLQPLYISVSVASGMARPRCLSHHHPPIFSPVFLFSFLFFPKYLLCQ